IVMILEITNSPLMQSRGFYPSRLGRYLVSSLFAKLYVTAMSPAKAQPIAPAGVGARATPARVRALAVILTGFGSTASAEDTDSDSRSASTSFFMASSLYKVYATARWVLPSSPRRRLTGARAGRAAPVRSGTECSKQHTPPPIHGQKSERRYSSPGVDRRSDGRETRMSQPCCIAARPGARPASAPSLFIFLP